MHIDEIHEAQNQTILFLHAGNVAGWMWRDQAEQLGDFHCLIPDLPAFGASNTIEWTDLNSIADDLAEIIRTRAKSGRAHVVGLSMGGILGVVLAARHPELISSILVSGTPLRGVGGFNNWSGRLQIRFWGSRAYWAGLARAYRMPEESVEEFISTGLGINIPSATRAMNQIYAGIDSETLDGLRSLEAPLLALAGEKEPRVMRDSLLEIRDRAPHAAIALVPRMHHVWSAEDPELFHRVLKHWLTATQPSPELTVL